MRWRTESPSASRHHNVCLTSADYHGWSGRRSVPLSRRSENTKRGRLSGTLRPATEQRHRRWIATSGRDGNWQEKGIALGMRQAQRMPSSFVSQSRSRLGHESGCLELEAEGSGLLRASQLCRWPHCESRQARCRHQSRTGILPVQSLINGQAGRPSYIYEHRSFRDRLLPGRAKRPAEPFAVKAQKGTAQQGRFALPLNDVPKGGSRPPGAMATATRKISRWACGKLRAGISLLRLNHYRARRSRSTPHSPGKEFEHLLPPAGQRVHLSIP